ncbi:hypothetical protein J5X84_25285 [Streptosporangiaceae bacterium NEAU-GS5]|nr:hypothetical protein [Streptosporangiaceae bacterium NEAU-GS5]
MRDETPDERADRNLVELLQGLRVAATGVQVLFAFLLTLPFSNGWNRVDFEGRWLFYAALVMAAIASICLIAPAFQHRVLFRAGLKEILVKRANRQGVAGGVALAVSMACSTALVVEVYLGTPPAALLAAGVALLSGWLWFVQPLVTRYRLRGEIDDL